MIKALSRTFKFSNIRFFVQSELDASSKIEISAQQGDNVAKEMKKQKIPLAFECGFNCSCSTCAVKLQNTVDYNKLEDNQPQSEEEKNVLETEGKLGRIRLTCQLKVAQELNGMILYI